MLALPLYVCDWGNGGNDSEATPGARTIAWRRRLRGAVTLRQIRDAIGEKSGHQFSTQQAPGSI
jgi:hypothetical protein